MTLGKLLVLPIALGLIACGPPVTVKRVSPQDVYQRDSASILDSDEATRFTQNALHLESIGQDEGRGQMLTDLHRQETADGRREGLLSLAELAFLEGEQSRDPAQFLGAAVYAYLYLFGGDLEAPTSPWDPRTRIAADIYNRALARAFSTPNGDYFVLEGGSRQLPLGQLAVTVPQKSIDWGYGVHFDTFLPADVFEVTGLQASYRRAGLGAPLIALRTDGGDVGGLFPAELETPATAFLRVQGDLEELQAGTLRATLELYDPLQTPTIEVAGETVPLEAQTTIAYAHLLGDSPLWDFELAGFLSGGDETIPPGISITEPYRPDAIPVLFVHGTASSPARWAGLFNDLVNDPQIHEHFQFWFFTYNSGNPIAYSAALLRNAIDQAVEELDPEGDDRALHDMVLIGHSQGGLLVRLAISNSSDLDWEKLGLKSLDDLDVDDEARETLTDMLVFEPSPPVKRVIFIATPHRGSFIAGGIFGRIGAALVSVSKQMLKLPIQAVIRPLQYATGAEAGEDAKMPTAVDNMAPNSRFNEILKDVPMSPDVARHSIIAVQTDGPVEKGNDGVVAYESAHLDDVESEIVIPSGHSVQSNALTVREVRRILLEHLKQFEEKPTAAPHEG